MSTLDAILLTKAELRQLMSIGSFTISYNEEEMKSIHSSVKPFIWRKSELIKIEITLDGSSFGSFLFVMYRTNHSNIVISQ